MKEFNEYVNECFSVAGGIVIKSMMGGYLVYLNGKLIGARHLGCQATLRNLAQKKRTFRRWLRICASETAAKEASQV